MPCKLKLIPHMYMSGRAEVYFLARCGVQYELFCFPNGKGCEVAPHGYAIDRAVVRQKKTGQPVKFETLSRHARQLTII